MMACLCVCAQAQIKPCILLSRESKGAGKKTDLGLLSCGKKGGYRPLHVRNTGGAHHSLDGIYCFFHLATPHFFYR